MRLRVQRRGLVPAAVVALIGTVVLYLASTVGLAAWNTSRAAPESGPGYLPSLVENVPPTVATTGAHGPPGSVAVVYAGTEVEDGLTGELEQPWIAVSALTGDYRALDLPDLPAPRDGAVAVSPDGTLLAWAGSSGLHLYDTVSGAVTSPEVPDVDVVGDFSSDGRHLVVHTSGLAVVEVDSGEVVSEAEGTAAAVDSAAWRADGSALDHVTGGELVTVAVPGGEVTTQRTDIPEDAQLAWSPEGDRLVDLRDENGVFRLHLSEVAGDGTLRPSRQVDTSGFSLQHLFGFSGSRTVAVDAYVLESGSVERVLDIPLDQGSTADLMTLPGPGENWVDTATVRVAADTLLRGSVRWDTPLWPWSYTARLVASVVVMFFLFGLYVTRRPRERRR